MNSPKPPYQLYNTGQTESQYEMLKKLEMPKYWYKELINLCVEFHIDFISTPYDTSDVDFLETMNVLAYKVPSALAIEPNYLKVIAQTKKPIFLSTGMCTLSEVPTAIDYLVGAGNNQIILMQCTTNYPSRDEDCNLNVIPHFEKIFGLPVGYSDHTKGLLAATIALSLGACTIERHFTLNRKLLGPDHSSSSEPDEICILVKLARKITIMLGSPYKALTDGEKANLFAMRRSLVAACNIAEGEVLCEKHFACKRPAKGLPPKFMDLFIGKRASSVIQKDTFFKLSDVKE